MFNLIILIIGFIMLIKGADIFVESASNIAKRFKVPSIIIGMTIVAMGTSAPELSVSVTSSLAGFNDMSIANVVGSNIFNLLMVLGICSLFGKLKINNYKDVWYLLFVCIELVVFSFDGQLSFGNGIILLITFAEYIISMIKQAKDNPEKTSCKNQKTLFLTFIYGILGLVAIIWGGNLVVNSAQTIALQLGMSENLVGLTVVALGTSLPEFITSIIATRKGELDIAIGNILGSNIFNILLILGIASMLNPMAVSALALCDTIFMIVSVLVFILLTVKRKALCKAPGLILITLYVSYLITTIIR